MNSLQWPIKLGMRRASWMVFSILLCSFFMLQQHWLFFFFFNFLKPRSSPLSFTSAASIFWWPQLTFIILPPISFSCFRWRLKCYSLSGHSQSTQNLTFKLTAPAALVHVTHQNTTSCLVGYKYILLSNIRIFSQAYTSRLGTVSLFYLALCA